MAFRSIIYREAFMLPYYIMVVVPYFLSLVFKRKEYEDDYVSRKITITSFFVILIALLAFRDISCGTDLIRYQYTFNQANMTEWEPGITGAKDIGYFIFVKLFQYVTTDFHAFVAVVALLSLIPIFYFYHKESENAVLTIALFLTVAPFTIYFSGLRQILAMALVVPAWYYAKNKKLFRFALVVLIAVLFHHSGWVILFLYPLYHLSITKKWMLFLAPAALLVLILNKPIFRLVLLFTGENNYEISDTGAYTILILLVLFVVYSYVIPDESKLDQDIIAMRNILVLSVFIQCFAPVHTLVMRINYYFLLFLPVLIPKIARRSKYIWESISQISVVVMVIFFTFWFFHQAYTGGDKLNVFPYTTWLF